MKFIALSFCLLLSLNAQADIKWNIKRYDGSHQQAESQAVMMGLSSAEGLKVYLPTSYVHLRIIRFPLDVLQKAGLSAKEMVDLLKNYNESEAVLTIDAETDSSDSKVTNLSYINLGRDQ